MTHSFIPVSDEADGSQRRNPALELIHPVIQSGLGHENHVRPRNISIVLHVAQQRDGLESFTKTLRGKATTTCFRKKQILHLQSATSNQCHILKLNITLDIPFHQPGSHWFHSHRVKWASWVPGPGNLSTCQFSHLSTDSIPKERLDGA